MIRALTIFTLFACFLGQSFFLNAQQGCNSITYSLIKLEPCRYRLFVNPATPDCYNEATLLLQAGYYTGFSANSADGWVVEQLSPTVLLLTNSNGLFPAGSTRAVDFTFFEPGGSDPTFSVLYPNLCIMEGCFVDFQLEACPGGCVSGTVYRECKSAPYTNQATVAGSTVDLLDAMGAVVSSVETDGDGNYSICDLPPGQYIVRGWDANGHWTASVPATGQYAISVSAGENLLRNFGLCPPCSCDSIEIEPYRVSGSSDTSLYHLSIFNQNPYCFNAVNIELGAIGEFIHWDTLLPGWTVTLINPKLIQLHPPDTYLPEGATIPLDFSVSGAGDQEINVTTFWAAGMNSDTCSRNYVYPDQSEPLTDCCAIVPGPFNVVNNGDFSGGNTGFSSDFTYDNVPPLQQSGYWVGPNPNTIDPTYAACLGNGNMMVVNELNPPQKKFWYQTVPVTPNTNYILKFRYARVAGQANPCFVTAIGSSQFANDWWSGVGLCQWREECLGWNSGSNTSIVLSIKEVCTVAAWGTSQFVIDDIRFYPCPLPCEISASVTQDDGCGNIEFQAMATAGQPTSYTWCTNQTGPTLNVQLPCGPYTCTVTATCTGGGTASATASVNVSDNINPTAVCLPGVSYDLGTNCTLAITPGMIDGGSTDNCKIASMSVDPALITCGTFPVTLTVTDWCNNTSTCTTSIQVAEGVPPNIVCPPGYSANCNKDVGPTFTGFATATDNCTAAIKIMISHSDQLFGTPECDDYIERTWTAKDLCDNTSTCVQTISVKDNIPPVITNCPPSITVGVDPGKCYYTVPVYHIVVTDNCDPNPTLVCSFEDPTGTILPFNPPVQMVKGVSTIECRATDKCGNISLCSFQITVTDNQAPLISCPPSITVQGVLDPQGICSATVNGLTPTATDNCPIPSITYAITDGQSGTWDASGTTFSQPLSTVTYTVTDCGGATKTCTVIVKVECPPCTPLPGAACADTANVKIDCIPGVFGQYKVLFDVANQSGFNADRIELTSVTPIGALSPTVFTGNFPNGTAAPVSFTASGLPGTVICFKILLERTAPNGVAIQCCETAQTFCITLPECPTSCGCLGADNMSFTYTGYPASLSWPAVPVSCGNTTPVVLPCVPKGETPFAFHGVVHCDAADCLFGDFNWQMTDPNGAIVMPGGTTSFTGSNGQDGYFDIYNLFSNTLTIGVTYTITIKWYCGGKICSCDVKFQLTECDCQCGSPISNVAITSGNTVLPMTCGSPAAPAVPCPPKGNFVKITGKFQCQGSECLLGQQVNYTLTGPSGTIPGATLATPFFGFYILPQELYQTGQYSLTFQGTCNGHPCTPCTINFYHNCPEPCPCPDNTFNARVDKGFSTVSSGVACKACFVPKDLDPCETVEWTVGSVGPIGAPTTGNAPFCHTFSSTGTYSVTMKVTRKNQFGVDCATRSKTIQVKILCNNPLTCSSLVLSNPGFNENALAGGLNSGGSAPGWKGAFGNPELKEGAGALDGWSVLLTGNRDSSDVLSREQAACWLKDSGMLSLRVFTWTHDTPLVSMPLLTQQPGENLVVRLYRGAVPYPAGGPCDGSNCLELASIALTSPPDSSNWYTLDIPYDLTAWAGVDSCAGPMSNPNGLLVTPVVYVSNWLGEESGTGLETRSMVLLDNVCFEDQLVETNSTPGKLPVRIFPNPTTGELTIALPLPAEPGMSFQVFSITGQELLVASAEAGSDRQLLRLGDLAPGLYYLQVVSEGIIIGVEKFVKQ